MAKQFFFLILTIYWSIMGLQSWAATDVLEVQALQDMYRSLSKPVQLEKWKSEGGDPCAEIWKGVECFNSTIINLNLHGLGLTGILGFQLSNLKSLKHMDLSSNNIVGSIPYSLPPNLTYLNFAENKFTESIPYSIEKMKYLRHLNLSHNLLSGSLGDVFDGLENLKEMDLSFNNFTGDLPISFKTMTNLTSLFLNHNQFTGSVIFMANLSLADLNIEDNHFSGVIPENFQNIPNLRFGGNKFERQINYPAWRFPADIIPTEKNISSPPAANLSAFESHPYQTIVVRSKKRSNAVGVVLMIGVTTLVAACAVFAIFVQRKRTRERALRRLGSGQESMRSLPIDTVHDFVSSGLDYTSMSGQGSPHTSAFSSSPMITPSRLPPIRTKTLKGSKRKSFSRSRVPIGAKVYTIAELQIATNSFSEENFIGEGSLGSVYRAEFPDGTTLAVKNIKTVPLSIIEEQQFFDVIKKASCLKHPNIVTLLGYSMEHGQHLLVYEYIKNVSLDVALHRTGHKPLSWGLRIQIALGTGRALDYMHSSCLPPVAHSNLKAANILLDEELVPHVCDCGLAILRPLSSNTVKLKASEMAIADSGYIAPEHVQSGTGNTKADIYAFGVLLLELLTARKPFDISRPKEEQSLVRWASSKLHDGASLHQMVDPAIMRTIPPKSLSRFADIVSTCIQPEQEFRPPMSEIVESLTRLLKPTGPDGNELDSFERSFRSTNSKFFGSPTQSYYSV